MIYLCEREIGFDAVDIGFPSVDGCRAIVLVTAGGLFGYHLNGTLNANKRDAFVNFVTQHVYGKSLRTLYAASAGAGLPADHAELRDIATALNYNGAIYWGALPPGGSSYVHFQNINQNTCSITTRPWSDANDSVPGNKGNYVPGANRTMANGAAPGIMYTQVATAGLVACYPTAI
ncbi:hypothetical protein [Coralloluteibacterium thermophilus]|uniref:Uncharacterized protein n=1 Tax=Coralloluteibacterium thermophilum TaxID=2707049 RepID=A0ABV9NRH5_9GAMM